MTMAENGEEQGWTEEMSHSYIAYGNYFIPGKEQQTKTLLRLLDNLPVTARVVELCCGDGELAERLLEGHSGCRILAMDGSPEMIEHARKRLERFGDRVELRLFDLASLDWRSLDAPVDAVVSSLAIHHLTGNQKQELFRDVTQMLNPGGVFAIADPIEVIGETATRLAAEAWDEAVRQRSLEVDGNTNMYEEFLQRQWNMYRYMEPDDIDLPSPLFDQLKWLMEAGFEEVNVHWLLAGHAVFGGRKN